MASKAQAPRSEAETRHAAGVAALRRGRPDEAARWLLEALRSAEPEQETDIRVALAVAHRRTEDIRRALDEYARIAVARPASSDVWLNLGAAQADTGDLAGAVESFERATALDGAALQPRRALARVLNDLGLAEDAAVVCEAGLRVRQDDPSLLRDWARALKLQGRADQCIAVLRRGLQATPADSELLLSLAGAMSDDGLTDEALGMLRNVVMRRPDDGAARLLLCMTHLPPLYEDEEEVKRRRSEYANALDELRIWGNRNPRALAEAVGVSQPFYLPYQGRNDRELQVAYGYAIHQAMAAVCPQPALPSPPEPGEKIRVGIVSGYFRAHASWRLPTEGWVRGLDRSRFRLFGYHTRAEQDATTLKAAALFERFVQGPMTTARWRHELAADAPHVLIYPEVGMDPAALRLATQRLAPLQCNSWGHPVTSGLPSLDVFLSSDAMEPVDAQDAYSERLVRLPGLSTTVHRRTTHHPAVSRADLGLSETAVLFWCGQSPFKYLPRQLDLLARIAAQVPDAAFVFTAFPGSDRLTSTFSERLKIAFARRRPARAEQVSVLPRMTSGAFAAAMATADLVLDSLDWSGCNTLVESVEAGLPIVTTRGRFMRGRHGAALLATIGLGDRVCRDENDYVATAVRLARNPDARSEFAALIEARRDRLFGDTSGVGGLSSFLRDFFQPA